MIVKLQSSRRFVSSSILGTLLMSHHPQRDLLQSVGVLRTLPSFVGLLDEAAPPVHLRWLVVERGLVLLLGESGGGVGVKVHLLL